MSYTVPVFNLFADVWFAGKTPAADLPDVENLPTQKYLYSRMVWDVQPCELEQFTPPILIRIPFTDFTTWINAQVFECPSESGQYYRARFKEIMHEGFSNQYLVAVVVQCNGDGDPMIRHIEGAVPCAAPPAEIGSADADLVMEFAAEGDATAGGGGGPFEGDADVALVWEMPCISLATP